MVTEVIWHNHPYADLDATLNSIKETEEHKKEQVKILVLDKHRNFAEAFREALRLVTTEYVHFSYGGDCISKDAYKAVLKCFSEEKKDEKRQIVSLKPADNGAKAIMEEYGDRILLDKNPYDVPAEINTLFFRTEFLKDIALKEELKYFGELELLFKVYKKEKTVYTAKSGKIKDREDNITNLINYSNSSKREWYEEFLEYFSEPVNVTGEEGYAVYEQYLLFYVMRLMFLHNYNSRDKYVYHTDYEGFVKKSRQVLLQIDDKIIANVNEYVRFQMDRMALIYLFKVKYDGDSCFHYVLEGNRAHVYLAVNNIMLSNITAEDIRLEVLKAEEKEFVLECSMRVLAKGDDLKLHCRMNKKELQVEETYRYSHVKFFGRSFDRRRTYRVHIPYEMLKKRVALAFYSELMGYQHVLKVHSKRFTSGLNSEVDSAYVVKGKHIIDLRPDKKRMFFTPYTKRAHFGHERQYLKDLKKINKDLYDFRISYWLNYKKYKDKNIWISFDKLYKGGDCGEYFYKYAVSGNDGVTAEYLITKESADAKRLVEEGYKPLYNGTKEHKLKFLFAKVIAATHPNVPVYSGFTQEEFEYVKDLFHARVVCIQHGLAVQKLALNINQVYDNIERFYVASKYEKENLTKPIYGYQKDAIKLTGIPRFDGLKNDDKRQILISPTWRSYIAMPPSVGNARSYSPTFKETDYFKIYQSLISNEQLLEAAKKYNYSILYLLHPTISSQLEDYKGNEVVSVVAPVGASYEEILTQSSLMLTDYSGVQFDFAYMRKPIVYYHPDKLPPHYGEGGFHYDKMGFGEIIKEEDELVKVLIRYMETGCQMTDFYRKRADDFFAYSDDKSCERIYEDVRKLQSEI